MHEDKGARYERVFQHPARKIPMSGGHVRIIYQDRARRRRPIRQFVLQRLRHQILIECIGQPNLRDRAGSHLRNGLAAFALSPGTRVYPAASICHWLCDSRTRILFHCQGNVREATHPDGAGCSRRKIDHPSAFKRSPVIDGHHNGLAVSPTRDADS